MAGLWITPDDFDDETLRDSQYAVEACETASYLLWAMSGRKFSGLTKTRELYEFNTPSLGFIADRVTIGDLQQAFLGLPTVTRDYHKRIQLRGTPLRQIGLIKRVSNGSVLANNEYYVTDHRVLNFRSEISDILEITYSYGTPPPAAGRMAARALAIEFAKLWGGRADECELPDRVTQVTRQQVSWTILDNQDFIADLRTGVYSVDLFLKTANPGGARQRAKVFSPDIPRGRRVTQSVGVPAIIPDSWVEDPDNPGFWLQP